ncbi:MAG: hypothetical protein EXR66_09015 [Dehalococcoidia bacterium]|nr:hypothetical protein [Dehalococcoidia bacterium]
MIHGDARVPQAFKTEDGYRIGTWVSKQRTNRSTLAAERVARLEALSGWVWEIRQRRDEPSRWVLSELRVHRRPIRPRCLPSITRRSSSQTNEATLPQDPES